MRTVIAVVIAAAACAPADAQFIGQEGGVTGGDEPLQATCGDGLVNDSESCDDGNNTSGDGCSSTCAVEVGYLCRSGAPPGTSSSAASLCFPSGYAWFFDADDAVAADGASISSWDAVPSQLAPPTGALANRQPIREAQALNGHSVAALDGTRKIFQIFGSAGNAAVVADTLKFHFAFVIRYDARQNFDYWLTDSTSGTERGVRFVFNTSGGTTKSQFQISKASGVTHLDVTETTALSMARWHVLEFKGDGTNYSFATDCGSFGTPVAFTNTPPTTGELVRDFVLGNDNPTDSTAADVAVALGALWPRALASGERTNLCNTLTRAFGSFPVSPAHRVANLGTSITHGGHANTGFVPRLEALVNTASPGSIATGNYGLDGDVSTNMRSRHSSTIVGKGYTDLIWEGICLNDLSDYAPDDAPGIAATVATCETNLDAVVTAARADNEEVYLLTTTPSATCTPVSTTNKQAGVSSFNTYVRSLAGSQGGHVHLIDVNADTNLGQGSPSQLKAGNTDDGCHLIDAGTDIVAADMKTAMGF